MTLRSLQHLYHQWSRSQAQRQYAGVTAVLDESHQCWMESPNRYVTHDIGFKRIRFPSGTRRVRVTKVRDTAGVTFYTLPADTPLT